MTYSETKEYLESFVNYEKHSSYPYKESLKLERIKGFLDLLGNPERGLRCVHIAGTKGKGSTAAFIAYILREAGFRTGLYTSPHLRDFRERIRILDPDFSLLAPGHDFEGMISRGSLSRIATRLKPVIQKYNRVSEFGPLTFFEAYTTIAFVYFKEKKVDFAVLETGLGGRLDATNAVDALVSVITPISYEHTQKLGKTLRKIAGEKAGIIKNPGLIVISAAQKKEAGDVIRKRCRLCRAKLYEAGRQIRFRKEKSGFAVRSFFGAHEGLRIQLLGRHQIENAALSVAAVGALSLHGAIISSRAVKMGLRNARWPGRCEVVAKNPVVILDGAQNTASAAAIKQAVRDNFKYRRLILVLGISDDKDISGVCRQLYPLADEIVLTRANSSRATDPKLLVKYFKGKRTHATKSVKEAKGLARRLASKEDLVLVTGSLFVVGEFRENE